MKHLKKNIAIATISAVMIATLGTSFAQAEYKVDMNKPMTMQKESNMKDMRGQMLDNIKDNQAENGLMNQFFIKKLSDIDKATIQKHMKDLNDEMKNLDDAERAEIKALMGTSNTSDFMKSIQEAYMVKRISTFNTHILALKPFIDTSKIVEFDKFITKRIELFSINSEIRKNMKETKIDIKETKIDMGNKKQEMNKGPQVNKIPASIQKRLDAKLDSIPEDKKSDSYALLITNIDALITKTTNVRKKALYVAVRDYIQMKMEELSSSDDLNDVLNNL